MADGFEAEAAQVDVEVVLASLTYGEILARAIHKRLPGSDLTSLIDVCRKEVFLASEDMARSAQAEHRQELVRARSEGCDAA